MNDQVREAIESARSIDPPEARLFRPVEVTRRRSFEAVRAIILAVARELPEDMTMRDLRDELEDAWKAKRD